MKNKYLKLVYLRLTVFAIVITFILGTLGACKKDSGEGSGTQTATVAGTTQKATGQASVSAVKSQSPASASPSASVPTQAQEKETTNNVAEAVPVIG